MCYSIVFDFLHRSPCATLDTSFIPPPHSSVPAINAQAMAVLISPPHNHLFLRAYRAQHLPSEGIQPSPSITPTQAGDTSISSPQDRLFSNPVLTTLHHNKPHSCCLTRAGLPQVSVPSTTSGGRGRFSDQRGRCASWQMHHPANGYTHTSSYGCKKKSTPHNPNMRLFLSLCLTKPCADPVVITESAVHEGNCPERSSLCSAIWLG